MNDPNSRPMLSRLKRYVLIAGGSLIGGLLGALGGAAISLAIGLISKWTHPDDPSAGSVAIIAIALVPGGFLFGAGCGAAVVADRGRKPPAKRWRRIAEGDKTLGPKSQTPEVPGS